MGEEKLLKLTWRSRSFRCDDWREDEVSFSAGFLPNKGNAASIAVCREMRRWADGGSIVDPNSFWVLDGGERVERWYDLFVAMCKEMAEDWVSILEESRAEVKGEEAGA